uniref:Uncharacterized protein n=1 Tax=Anguilla anguilla TaxID=7936 RepID=A0A0E9WUK2_ANGAN
MNFNFFLPKLIYYGIIPLKFRKHKVHYYISEYFLLYLKALKKQKKKLVDELTTVPMNSFHVQICMFVYIIMGLTYTHQLECLPYYFRDQVLQAT